MFRVDLAQLRKCKSAFETQLMQLRREITELEGITSEIRKEINFEELWIGLVRETDTLKLKSVKLQAYLTALENIIAAYENGEYAVLRASIPLLSKGKKYRPILREVKYLDTLLSGVNIR